MGATSRERKKIFIAHRKRAVCQLTCGQSGAIAPLRCFIMKSSLHHLLLDIAAFHRRAPFITDFTGLPHVFLPFCPAEMADTGCIFCAESRSRLAVQKCVICTLPCPDLSFPVPCLLSANVLHIKQSGHFSKKQHRMCASHCIYSYGSETATDI